MYLKKTLIIIWMLLSSINYVFADTPLTLSSFFTPIQQDLLGVSALSYTFNGTTADSIDYIQLCYATDNTCNSCNVPFTVISGGTPIPYSTSGTTYRVPATSIAAYLSSNNFSGVGTPTYNIGMYVQSTHLHCASSTAYCGSKAGSNGHLLCMQATYDGTNVTALSQSDNGNVALDQSTLQYTYVADSSYPGNLYQCALNSDGTYKNCTTTPLSSPWNGYYPTGVTFAIIGGTQYAYVATTLSGVYQCTLNTDGTLNTCLLTASLNGGAYASCFATINGTQYSYVVDNSNVYYCTLNANGTFNACETTPSAGAPTSWAPQGVSIAQVNGVQYAYVADAHIPGNVYRCTLNANGKFNTCSITPSSSAPAWSPRDITFAVFNGTSYAYVASGAGSKAVYQCTLNNDGTFNTCNATPSAGVPSWTPYSVTFSTVSGIQYAYVGDTDGHTTYKCTLNTNGTFNTCNATPSSGAPSWTPTSIGMPFIFPAPQYAYVASSTGTLYQCTLNNDGTFNTCNATPSSGAPAWTPYGLSFTRINGTQYAYVASQSGNGIYRCLLGTDGKLTTCTATPSSPPWSTTYGVSFGMARSTQYAYVVNNAHVYRCTLNADGTFNTCVATPATGEPSWSPQGVTVKSVGTTQYAYVADATGSGHVYQCPINDADGTFITCTATPSSGAPTSWSPREVSFGTVNGTQYAYVGSGGGAMYQCTLNSDGTFNTCQSTTGPGWSNPYSVTLSTVDGLQYAYVADFVTSGSVYQCTLNANGTFNICTATPSSSAPAWTPRFVVLASF